MVTNFHPSGLMLWLSILWMLLLQIVQSTPASYSRSGRYMEAKCTDPETGRELFIGDAYTRWGKCVRVQCLGDLNIWEDRCQVPKLNGNCTSIPAANEFLSYPKCCPTYECRTSEINDVMETEEINTYDHYGILRKTRIRQAFVVEKPLQGTAVVPSTGARTQFNI